MDTTKKLCGMMLMCISLSAFAQKVTVTKDSERIKGSNIEGYAAELTGTIEAVSTSYTKYLTTLGKLKASGNQIPVNEAEISFTKYSAPIYAATRNKGEKVLVWLGLNEKEWSDAAQAESARKDLEKVVYDFGVKFYRDNVQVDIDESVRAQQATEKQTLRLQNENKNLTSRMEFNQKEKLRLEKALADNKLEYETLVAGLAKNKKDQDSVSVATDQIKKMVEAHKERQRKVN
jgi:hypothetical protein